MPIITTKSITDPKRTTELNWLGAPMKPGDSYAGIEPEGRKLSREEKSARIRVGQAKARALGKVFGFKSQHKAQAT